MVRALPLPRRFLRDPSGIAMTEALIVLPLLILIFGAMVEFSVMVFQWNQTAKAMQVGARRAAVSTPLTDISSLSDYTGMTVGNPLPSSSPVSVSCGAGAGACIPAQLDRLYYGGDSSCGAYDTSGVVGVCDVAQFIGKSNLRITYTRSNLGYVGRPAGPVLTVTVEARNLYFDFFLLDKIMALFGPLGFPAGIPIPTQPVAVTSEDLCNGKTCP